MASRYAVTCVRHESSPGGFQTGIVSAGIIESISTICERELQ